VERQLTRRQCSIQSFAPDIIPTVLSRLPEDYTIFHGVYWTREYQSRRHFGEIDAVVLNRSGEVLLPAV